MGSELTVTLKGLAAVVFDAWSGFEDHPFTELLTCERAALRFGPVVAASLAGQSHVTSISRVQLQPLPHVLSVPKHAWEHRLAGLRTELSGFEFGNQLTPTPVAPAVRSVDLVRNPIPVKLYFALEVETQGLAGAQAECLDPTIEAISRESLRLSPSVVLDASPPLPYWDKIRFQTQGPVRWHGQQTSFHTLVRVFSEAPPLPDRRRGCHTFRITYSMAQLSLLSCVASPCNVPRIFHQGNLDMASPEPSTHEQLTLTCLSLPLQSLPADEPATLHCKQPRQSSSVDYFSPEPASDALFARATDLSAIAMVITSLNVTIPHVSRDQACAYLSGDPPPLHSSNDPTHPMNQRFRFMLVPHLELCTYLHWQNSGYLPSHSVCVCVIPTQKF
jgi:hypothetical protein